VDYGHNRRKRYCVGFILSATLYLLLFTLSFTPATARASGEIVLVRAAEEIPEGDDVTIVVSTSARETDIDRTLALEYPAGWKFKRAWRVEAGSDHAVNIGLFSEVTSLLLHEPEHNVLALADYSEDFDPDADGIAYFIVFTPGPIAGKAVSETATVKAALVERADPDAPPQIDPKTKKRIPVNTDWRMTFPSRYDFSFGEITSKKFVASIEIKRTPRTARGLLLDGTKYAMALLQGRPELLKDYFQHPFSIQCWFRSNGFEQNLLRMQSEDSSEVRLAIGLLGQVSLELSGTHEHIILASHAIVNDGAWHDLVLSNDSLGNVRLLVDAQPPVTTHVALRMFGDIYSLAIGDSSKIHKDFSMDELQLLKGAFRDPSEFIRGMMMAYHDTSHRAFAVFHFDDFGAIAKSSITENAPMYFTLDSAAYLRETTSPVESEPATLIAELISPTRVSIAWHTSSELGIRQYVLERRIGPYGPFEKVLAMDAKHGMKAPKRGQALASSSSYHASEDLPKLNGDIDLYYRVAIIGFGEKEQPLYTYPVKLEYAPNSDVFVEQNDPNPFSTSTTIAFRLTKPETVQLSIFDMIGREVAVIVNAKLDPGRHTYDLDATNWPQGIYFYKVKTNGAIITRKMVLLK
jgi:hypothetical protein